MHIAMDMYNYDNRPRYNILRILITVKNVNFQLKMFNDFLIFALNENCGYSLEPPP